LHAARLSNRSQSKTNKFLVPAFQKKEIEKCGAETPNAPGIGAENSIQNDPVLRTAWSTKRYLNIELLKDQQMRAGAIPA
jgi:hypothetical protein